jgi:hypothetical protein
MQCPSSRPYLFAVLGAALAIATSARAGAELPPLDDPQFVEWAGKASADLERYLADPKGTFTMPAEGQSFPCAVSPDVMSRIIGVHLPGAAPDEDLRKALARATRGTGMKPFEFTDIVVRPVQASCKEGKPAGMFKGWVEFTILNTTAMAVQRNRMRKYVETDFAENGERRGVVVERTITLEAQTEWTDPAMADMMRKNPVKVPTATTASFIYVQVNPDKSHKGLTLSHTAMGGDAPSVSTTLVLPKGPGRWLMVSYDGKQKTMEIPFRNNRMHGPQVHYARMYRGVAIPASTVCYDEGEQIKTTNCDVE